MSGAILRGTYNLTACKLVITMPAGGTVESSSGLYACAAQESCTIVVDHPYFNETFTAKAAPGYFFSHWAEGNGAFCAGKSSSTCTPFDTGFFLDNPDEADWLQYDVSYTITPVFLELGAQPTVEQRWTISSEHQLNNYPVDGFSGAEITDSLLSESNPLDGASDGAIGFTTSFISRSYNTTSDESGSVCEISDGAVEVIYVTTLPQLVEPEDKPADLADAWRRFQADVTEHEAEHQRINRQYAAELRQRYDALGPIACNTVGDEVRNLFNEWRQEVVAAHAQYHVDVGTSTSFSAYFTEDE